MDMQKVLDGLYGLLDDKRASILLPVPGRKTDKDHLVWMLDQIRDGRKTGEKAHRWIGYVQGVIVAYGVTTVEDMRDLNR